MNIATSAFARPAAQPPIAQHEGMERDLQDFATRRHILFVGKRLFAHFGYAATSIVDIAQATDLSAKELLRQFRNKPRLLLAIFDNAWKAINPKIDDVVFASMDTNEVMLEIFTALIRIFDEDRDLAKLWLFEGHCQRDENGGVLLSAGYKRFKGLIRDLVVRGQQDGTYKDSFEPSVIASLIISGMEGLTRDWLLSERERGTTPYTGIQLISSFNALLSGLRA